MCTYIYLFSLDHVYYRSYLHRSPDSYLALHKKNEKECILSLLHVHTGHMHFISLLRVLFTPKLYRILGKPDKQTTQSSFNHLSQRLPFSHFGIITYCIPDFDSCQPGCATFRPFAVPLDSSAFRSGVLESS